MYVPDSVRRGRSLARGQPWRSSSRCWRRHITRSSTRPANSPPDEAPPFAAEWVRKVEALPGDADEDEPGRAGHGRLGPLPPAVAGQHAAVPDRQGAVLRRELLQRGARVRAAATVAARATRSCRATCCARASTAGSTWRSRTNCGSTTRITCPIFTVRPQNDLPIVPIYTNIFAPPLPRPERFVELGQTHPRADRRLAERLRVAVIGSGHLSLELGGPASSVRTAPTRSSTPRPSSGSPTATSTAAWRNVTLDSLHAPGNATHGFMDFMLMMGVAGYNKADYADNLDLFHTMEAYFTWYPNGVDAMSKYLLNKFLFTVDRDPELVEQYRDDPVGTVAWWEARAGEPVAELPRGRGVHLAAVHRRRADGAGDARSRGPVRDGRAPVPDPDAVDRDVRAGLRPSRWRCSWTSRRSSPTSRCRTRTSRHERARVRRPRRARVGVHPGRRQAWCARRNRPQKGSAGALGSALGRADGTARRRHARQAQRGVQVAAGAALALGVAPRGRRDVRGSLIPRRGRPRFWSSRPAQRNKQRNTS